MKTLAWIFDRFFIVLGAFIGSQIPEFMQQYTQRLGGHVDELSHLLAALKKSVARNHKNIESYIQKFLSNSDTDITLQGEFMQSILLRWQKLSASLHSLVESSVWERPYVFVKNLDSDIFASTVGAYHPGISLTVEGLCYTVVGVLLGSAVYQVLRVVGSAIARSKA